MKNATLCFILSFSSTFHPSCGSSKPPKGSNEIVTSSTLEHPSPKRSNKIVTFHTPERASPKGFEAIVTLHTPEKVHPKGFEAIVMLRTPEPEKPTVDIGTPELIETQAIVTLRIPKISKRASGKNVKITNPVVPPLFPITFEPGRSTKTSVDIVPSSPSGSPIAFGTEDGMGLAGFVGTGALATVALAGLNAWKDDVQPSTNHRIETVPDDDKKKTRPKALFPTAGKQEGPQPSRKRKTEAEEAHKTDADLHRGRGCMYCEDRRIPLQSYYGVDADGGRSSYSEGSSSDDRHSSAPEEDISRARDAPPPVSMRRSGESEAEEDGRKSGAQAEGKAGDKADAKVADDKVGQIVRTKKKADDILNVRQVEVARQERLAAEERQREIAERQRMQAEKREKEAEKQLEKEADRQQERGDQYVDVDQRSDQRRSPADVDDQPTASQNYVDGSSSDVSTSADEERSGEHGPAQWEYRRRSQRRESSREHSPEQWEYGRKSQRRERSREHSPAEWEYGQRSQRQKRSREHSPAEWEYRRGSERREHSHEHSPRQWERRQRSQRQERSRERSPVRDERRSSEHSPARSDFSDQGFSPRTSYFSDQRSPERGRDRSDFSNERRSDFSEQRSDENLIGGVEGSLNPSRSRDERVIGDTGSDWEYGRDSDDRARSGGRSSRGSRNSRARSFASTFRVIPKPPKSVAVQAPESVVIQSPKSMVGQHNPGVIPNKGASIPKKSSHSSNEWLSDERVTTPTAFTGESSNNSTTTKDFSAQSLLPTTWHSSPWHSTSSKHGSTASKELKPSHTNPDTHVIGVVDDVDVRPRGSDDNDVIGEANTDDNVIQSDGPLRGITAKTRNGANAQTTETEANASAREDTAETIIDVNRAEEIGVASGRGVIDEDNVIRQPSLIDGTNVASRVDIETDTPAQTTSITAARADITETSEAVVKIADQTYLLNTEAQLQGDETDVIADLAVGIDRIEQNTRISQQDLTTESGVTRGFHADTHAIGGEENNVAHAANENKNVAGEADVERNKVTSDPDSENNLIPMSNGNMDRLTDDDTHADTIAKPNSIPHVEAAVESPTTRANQFGKRSNQNVKRANQISNGDSDGKVIAETDANGDSDVINVDDLKSF